MTSDRWRRIEELYHAALERSAADRAAFLAAACAGDEELRRDVESLLASDARAQTFLAESAMHVAASDVGESGVSLVGRRLGSYQLLARIGAGGMGEVCRARDTKLGRDVALKILPTSVAHDADRVARFRREAQMLASLNHPRIAHIHGLEEADGEQFLILELVEGQTLAERLSAGRLPIGDAIAVARQIAEGLEAAHEKGIIHRDLKPANIAFTATGEVKLLDFGLAKALDASSALANATQSPAPTTSGVVTDVGVILGTVAYMSPEQATGRPADKRSDIWAFGCVLYEMLTGRVAFAGDSVSDTIATILTRELDWSALPPATPAHVRRLLERCLRKDPKQRLHDIADARIELEDSSTAPLDAPSITGGRKPIASMSTSIVAAGLALLGLGALVASRLGGSRPETFPVTHVQINVSPAETLPPRAYETATAIALSPDGRTLAFIGRRGTTDRIYLRPLNRREAVALVGTDGANHLFFSPDGHWIGFRADDILKRVAVDGGPPVQICRAEDLLGASWGSDDTIVFGSRSGGLMRVPAGGGTPEELTTPDRAAGEVNHRLPHFVPGAKAVLFTIVRNAFDPRMSQIAVVTMATRARRVLLDDGSDGQYVPSGHLIFGRLGKLFAVPFDVERLQVRGVPAGILDDVMQSAGGRSATETFAVQVAVSSTGELAYVPGGPLSAEDHAVVWFDRNGGIHPLPLAVAEYWSPRLSPDGRRVAFDSRGLSRSIWVYDLERGTSTAITQTGTPAYPVWTPDGKRLAFGAGATGGRNLFWSPADGSSAPERLTTSEFPQWPASWSPDGRTLLFIQGTPSTKNDIWALDVTRRPPAARPVIRTPGYDWDPTISPDGRWLAYTSDESGTAQVYVQPYPALDSLHQVSVNGGTSPVWSRDGRTLFFVEGVQFRESRLFSVDVTPGPTFSAGIPRLVLDLPPSHLFQGGGVTPNYDVTRDGTRFLGIQIRPGPTQPAPTEIQLTFNALAELRARAPLK